MTKLESARPVLVLLYGYPGSGKSFLARNLTDSLRAAHINGDKIRSILFENPRFDSKEDDIVNSLMEYMTGEYLQAGISAIYDSNNLTIKQRRNLRNLGVKHNAINLIIWVQTDLESAFTRVVKRDRRRIDDRYARAFDRSSFDAVVGKMQRPTDSESYIVVSGKHSTKTQISTVVKRLRELGLVDPALSNQKLIKPDLINLVPKATGGRVDMSRRDISIR